MTERASSQDADPATSPATTREKIDFLMELGSALHRYGTPAHRLEDALGRLARRLGFSTNLVSFPTSLFAQLENEDGVETRIARVNPGAIDLEKLWRVDQLGDAALAEDFSFAKGRAALEAITLKPSRYPLWLGLVAFATASGSLAVLLRGGLWDVFVAAVTGVVTGLVVQLAQSRASWRVLSEALAAFVASITIYALHFVVPASSIPTALLASLIVLMPGLSLTLALTELATQNLVAGSARLTGVGSVLFKLALGAYAGAELMERFFAVPPYRLSVPLPAFTQNLALVASALCFVVLFRAHPRHAGWVVMAALTGQLVTSSASSVVEPAVGVFVGGLVVGVLSNVIASRRRIPVAITLIPGIILLVPGSLGYKSLTFFYAAEPLEGVETAFSMLMIAMTLVAGTLLGNVFVAARRSF